MRIALVTEELAGLGLTGGIGAAFEELALALAKSNFEVDLLHVPVDPLPAEDVLRAATNWSRMGVKLIVPNLDEYVWNRRAPAARSYAIFRYLYAQPQSYDVIHFHDYKGLGFYSLNARRQKLALGESEIVIQVHGPTRWALEANREPFSHPEQLQIDFMERRSIETADRVVAPSKYMLDWLRAKGVSLPPGGRTQVIQNAYGQSLASIPRASRRLKLQGPVSEIIYFGRHEKRKGFMEFCSAISMIEPLLRSHAVSVTLIGQLGAIDNVPSVVHLAEKAKAWSIPVNVFTGFDRYQAMQYMAHRHCVIAIPSPVENLPYTVCEAAALGKPVITSGEGGAREWLAAHLHEVLLFEPQAKAIAERLATAVEHGLPAAELSESVEIIEKKWIAFHEEIARGDGNVPPKVPTTQEMPSVVLGITHFERPEKLLFSFLSAARQTYKNLQIVIYDDGSPSEETQAQLDDLEPLVKKLGATLIRGTNKYLGGARNAIAAATNSDYLIFLDDDDLAFNDMVETLVAAALATDADVVGCPNLYLELSRRAQYEGYPERLQTKLAYAPTAGPLSLATMENCLCAATALIRRTHFEKLGGYSELTNVGYEDYEFFLRSLQSEARFEIVPMPLYLYEVGRPSMASQTSRTTNQSRVLQAIDFSRNAGEWSDVASLMAGIRTREDLSNHRTWLISQSQHKDVLTRLQAFGSVRSTDYLVAAADYAEAVGAPALARAFRDGGAQAPDAEPSVHWSKRPMFPLMQASESPVRYKDEHWHLMLDCALGRRRDALLRLTTLLSGSPFLDEDMIGLVSGVLVMLDQVSGRSRGSAATEDLSLVRDLVRSLCQIQYAPEQGDAVSRLGVQAACAVNDPGLLEIVIRGAIDADQLDYLGDHPDVAEAGGNKPDFALKHFREYGLAEGRRGFSRARLLCRLLEEAGHTKWHPWSLASASPDLLLKQLKGSPTRLSVHIRKGLEVVR